MNILFIPQVRETEKIVYEFSECIVKTTYNGKTDTFDFSKLPDGVLLLKDDKTGESLIETELEYQPIKKAWKEDGILYVKLVNFIGLEASEEECFPDWIDHTEYIPPKVGEVNGQDEMEE